MGPPSPTARERMGWRRERERNPTLSRKTSRLPYKTGSLQHEGGCTGSVILSIPATMPSACKC